MGIDKQNEAGGMPKCVRELMDLLGTAASQSVALFDITFGITPVQAERHREWQRQEAEMLGLAREDVGLPDEPEHERLSIRCPEDYLAWQRHRHSKKTEDGEETRPWSESEVAVIEDYCEIERSIEQWDQDARLKRLRYAMMVRATVEAIEVIDTNISEIIQAVEPWTDKGSKWVADLRLTLCRFGPYKPEVIPTSIQRYLDDPDLELIDDPHPLWGWISDRSSFWGWNPVGANQCSVDVEPIWLAMGELRDWPFANPPEPRQVPAIVRARGDEPGTRLDHPGNPDALDLDHTCHTAAWFQRATTPQNGVPGITAGALAKKRDRGSLPTRAREEAVEKEAGEHTYSISEVANAYPDYKGHIHRAWTRDLASGMQKLTAT